LCLPFATQIKDHYPSESEAGKVNINECGQEPEDEGVFKFKAEQLEQPFLGLQEQRDIDVEVNVVPGMPFPSGLINVSQENIRNLFKTAAPSMALNSDIDTIAATVSLPCWPRNIMVCISTQGIRISIGSTGKTQYCGSNPLSISYSTLLLWGTPLLSHWPPGLSYLWGCIPCGIQLPCGLSKVLNPAIQGTPPSHQSFHSKSNVQGPCPLCLPPIPLHICSAGGGIQHT